MKKTALLTIFLFSLFATYAQKQINIVTNGKSDYIIVVPHKAFFGERDAAKLFQDALQKTCKVKMMIVDDDYPRQDKEILIGSARGIDKTFSNAGSYMSSYVVSGQKLIFNGENTYYSVVDFLEREMDIRVYTPDCMEYPQRKNFAISAYLSYSYNSPNVFREVNSSFTKRNKDYQKWLKTDLYTQTFAQNFFVHTAYKLCSDKEYFQTHPEYFALVNGQRVRDQVCWSNEKVFQIMKANLKKQMDEQPDKNWWSVSQNDNPTYCKCDKCLALIKKEGTPAAPILAFVNKMADAFPDKLISTLAYQYSRKCPKTIKPRQNVQIMLCTIEANRNITIEQDKQRSGGESFAKDLEDWAKVSKNIFLWDYECNFAHYMSPFPNIHVLQPNIRYFVKMGVNMQFQQANCNKGHEFAELKNYLLAKLLWNPNENADKIIDDFMHAYYGAGAEKVRQYMNDLEEVAISYQDEVGLDIYGPVSNYKETLFSEKNLRRFDSILYEAEALVVNDPKAYLRVQTAHLPIHYAILEVARTEIYGKRGFFKKEKKNWVLIDEMKYRAELFYEICKKAQVESLNEKGLKPKTYYDGLKRIMSYDINGNIAFNKPVSLSPNPAGNYCKGNPKTLTDGTRGAADFKMNWLGWQGTDCEITVNMLNVFSNRKATISTLNLPSAWVLHPLKITCLVSLDGKHYTEVGQKDAKGDKQGNPAINEYSFDIAQKFRYVKFVVQATKTLPSWHASYTQKSWVFIDEVIVR